MALVAILGFFSHSCSSLDAPRSFLRRVEEEDLFRDEVRRSRQASQPALDPAAVQEASSRVDDANIEDTLKERMRRLTGVVERGAVTEDVGVATILALISPILAQFLTPELITFAITTLATVVAGLIVTFLFGPDGGGILARLITTAITASASILATIIIGIIFGAAVSAAQNLNGMVQSDAVTINKVRGFLGNNTEAEEGKISTLLRDILAKAEAGLDAITNGNATLPLFGNATLFRDGNATLTRDGNATLQSIVDGINAIGDFIDSLIGRTPTGIGGGSAIAGKKGGEATAPPMLGEFFKVQVVLAVSTVAAIIASILSASSAAIQTPFSQSDLDSLLAQIPSESGFPFDKEAMVAEFRAFLNKPNDGVNADTFGAKTSELLSAVAVKYGP